MKSIVSKVPGNRIQISKELGDEGLSIQFADGGQLLITAFLSGVNYANRQFVCFPVITPHIGEAQFVTLASKELENKTAGYIFPISSLRCNSVLGTQDKWVRAFGRAAAVSILEKGILNDLIDFKSESDPIYHTIDIADILPTNVAIAVLGKEKLHQSGNFLDSIKISLQEYGYRLPPTRKAATNANYEFKDRISLKRISDGLHFDSQKVLNIIHEASHLNSPYSKFLCIYQVFELVIEKIFKHFIYEIRLSSDYTIDPWKARDRINLVCNEKWRLSKVRSEFSRFQDSNKYYEDVKESCLELLLKVQNDIDFVEENKDWADMMYLVRNTIVHRQSLVVGRFDDELDKICISLEMLCYKLIAGYTHKQLSK